MTKNGKALLYDPTSMTRLAPVEDMRIANLINRHRYIVDRHRKQLSAARISLEDAESVLAALLEKYPTHDREG